MQFDFISEEELMKMTTTELIEHIIKRILEEQYKRADPPINDLFDYLKHHSVDPSKHYIDEETLNEITNSFLEHFDKYLLKRHRFIILFQTVVNRGCSLIRPRIDILGNIRISSKDDKYSTVVKADAYNICRQCKKEGNRGRVSHLTANEETNRGYVMCENHHRMTSFVLQGVTREK